MGIEERVVNLEQAFIALNRLAKKADERADSATESIRLLTQMIQRHDERLDEHAEMFREADRSIAALADAQIHTEEAITHLTQKLDALIERLDRDRNGGGQ
jgi:Mg2+ and Co2+ transporter CorA